MLIKLLFTQDPLGSIINLLSCIFPSFQYKSPYQFSRRCLPEGGGGLSFTEFGLRVGISAGINRLPPSLISGKLANQLMTDIASSSRDADFLEHQPTPQRRHWNPRKNSLKECFTFFFPQDFGFFFSALSAKHLHAVHSFENVNNMIHSMFILAIPSIFSCIF
jgi:hypothetical protein